MEEASNRKSPEATIESLPELLAQLNKKPSENFKIPDFSQFHTEAKERLEGINKTLREVEQSLNDARMQTHMLNIDLVTVFEPQEIDELNTMKQECEKLLQQSKKRLAQQRWLLKMAETDQPIPLDIEQMGELYDDEDDTDEIGEINEDLSDKLAAELDLAIGDLDKLMATDKLSDPIKVVQPIESSLVTAEPSSLVEMEPNTPDEKMAQADPESSSLDHMIQGEPSLDANEMDETLVCETTDIQHVPLMEL